MCGVLNIRIIKNVLHFMTYVIFNAAIYITMFSVNNPLLHLPG